MAAWVDLDDEPLSSSSDDEDVKDGHDHNFNQFESVTQLDYTTPIKRQDIRYMKPIRPTIQYRVQKRPTEHNNDRSNIRHNAHQNVARAKTMNEFVDTNRAPNSSPKYKLYAKRPIIAIRDKARVSVSVQSTPKLVKQRKPTFRSVPDPTQTDEKQSNKPNHINFIIEMAP
eukprot:200602_1